ncbi:MAG: CoA transferase, partial [Dehalococcoidia bacterium]|nr:CoA transferase [Dehalococcoidia bacterium]
QQQRMGNEHPAAAPHAAYRCRGEDRWCVVAIFDEQEWQALLGVMGNPSWAADDRFGSAIGRKKHEAELDRLIEEWTALYPPEEVMRKLQAVGVPAGVVQNGADLHADPQLAHREHYQELEHLVIGRHTYDSMPFRLSKTPSDMRSAGPCLGQNNEYVYQQILGMPKEEYDELLLQGVFE